MSSRFDLALIVSKATRRLRIERWLRVGEGRGRICGRSWSELATMQGIIIAGFSSDRCEQAPQPRKFKPGAGRRRGYRGGPTPPCTIPAPARRASGRRPRGSENPERKPPPRTCIASQARATEAELSAAIARSFWGTYNLQGRPNSIGGVRHAGRVRSLRKGPGLGRLPPTNWGSLALLRGRARGRELQKSAGKHWESAPIRRVEGDELGEQLLHCR